MDGDGFSIAEPEDGAPEEAKAKRPRRRDVLALLLADVDLWRSPDGVSYASVPMGQRREHMRVAGKDFRTFILTTFYRREGAGLSGTALAETVALADARAQASGDVRRPWRRVALEDGAIWLDLGDNDPAGERRAVRITREGWQIVAAEDVAPAFIRAPDALPLPEPEADAAKAEDLRAFVNVESDDDLALAWAYLVCALRPFAEGGAYPLAVVHGEQGSGKTAACRSIQALVDPSVLTGRALPREERDLFVSASNRHLLAFDNLSRISDDFADSLCRIATGGGFAARSLHTDADESTFMALRPILLNGTPASLVGRPGLADRALSLELRRLEVRREEAEIAADFARMRPGLLGLLCDGLASALRNLRATKLADGPRMLDACTWAEAAAEGLGIARGLIAAAWRANRAAADRAAMEADDVARAVVAMLKKPVPLDANGAPDLEPDEQWRRGEWKGPPATLFRRLAECADERVTRNRNLWPQSVAGLSARITRFAPALRSVCRVDAVAGQGGAESRRWWFLRDLGGAADAAPGEAEGAADAAPGGDAAAASDRAARARALVLSPRRDARASCRSSCRGRARRHRRADARRGRGAAAAAALGRAGVG